MSKGQERIHDGSTPVRLGSALLLVAGVIPAVVSTYVAIAIGSTKTEALEKRMDGVEGSSTQTNRDISQINEKLGEIKGILSEMQKNKK